MSTSVWLTLGSAFGGALGAAGGWTITAFVGEPLRKFMNLRGEVIRRATEFANIPSTLKELREAPGEFERIKRSEEDTTRSKEAQRILRDLAAHMRTFAENEPLALGFVRLRYDPMRASAGLIGWSNTFDVYGESKASTNGHWSPRSASSSDPCSPSQPFE
jgi:hypothetical protein